MYTVASVSGTNGGSGYDQLQPPHRSRAVAAPARSPRRHQPWCGDGSRGYQRGFRVHQRADSKIQQSLGPRQQDCKRNRARVGQRKSLTLTAGGSGYSGTPTVTPTGRGGTGAAATASIETGGQSRHQRAGRQGRNESGFSGPQATDGAVQPEDHHAALWLRRRPGNCPATGACPNCGRWCR